MTNRAIAKRWTPSEAAAVSALGTSALIVFMDWVPTSLNKNIAGVSARSRLASSLIHGLSGLAVAGLHLRGGRRSALVGAAWYSTVMASAAANWWLPYLFGIQLGEVDSAIFAEEYADNLRVLPRIGDHVVVPDIQHVLIHSSVALSGALAWRSYVGQRGGNSSSRTPER